MHKFGTQPNYPGSPSYFVFLHSNDSDYSFSAPTEVSVSGIRCTFIKITLFKCLDRKTSYWSKNFGPCTLNV